MIPLLFAMLLAQDPGYIEQQPFKRTATGALMPAWYSAETTEAARASQEGADAPAIVWALHAGTLPPGLTLGAEGQLKGIPTQAGTYTFTIRATIPVIGAILRDVVVTIAPATVIDPAPAPPGVVGTAYQHQFQLKSQETIQ
jgi:hypothetical protein